MTDWRSLLESAIASDPRGMTGVAERIGYSRTAVSLARSGKYPNPDVLGKTVIAAYTLIDCPFLGHPIKAGDCRAYAQRTYQSINAADVDHWRACRKCPNNPANAEQE